MLYRNGSDSEVLLVLTRNAQAKILSLLLQVHDIKFQAPTLEEKESWIKALNEGINRGKNKVFDEVREREFSNSCVSVPVLIHGSFS